MDSLTGQLERIIVGLLPLKKVTAFGGKTLLFLMDDSFFSWPWILFQKFCVLRVVCFVFERFESILALVFVFTVILTRADGSSVVVVQFDGGPF